MLTIKELNAEGGQKNIYPSNQRIKLDYTIEKAEDRIKEVRKILSNMERKPTNYQLEILTNYIEDAYTLKERKEHGLLNNNRRATINKRETSFEGLVEKFENGEDGVYNLINENKNLFLTPKVSISAKDVAEVPGLAELREAIEQMKEICDCAQGKDKFIAKKNLIDMQQTQYILKDNYQQPVHASNFIKTIASFSLDEHITLDENDEPISDGIVNYFDPKHVAAILANYSGLKQEADAHFESDFFYFLIDFDRIADAALQDFPVYEAIVTYKIDGMRNADIAERLLEEFGFTYSQSYLSVLWKHKIPEIIADKAKEQWLIYHYTFEDYGKWKKCSRCGQIKLMHNRWFSKNNDSEDGYYSICKCCRKKKGAKK